MALVPGTMPPSVVTAPYPTATTVAGVAAASTGLLPTTSAIASSTPPFAQTNGAEKDAADRRLLALGGVLGFALLVASF